MRLSHTAGRLTTIIRLRMEGGKSHALRCHVNWPSALFPLSLHSILVSHPSPTRGRITSDTDYDWRIALPQSWMNTHPSYAGYERTTYSHMMLAGGICVCQVTASSPTRRSCLQATPIIFNPEYVAEDEDSRKTQ